MEDKMQKLSTYIDNIDFNYMISYSGLRGEAWEALKNENGSKIEQLEKDIVTARYMQKPKIGQEIQNLKEEIDLWNSRIIELDGKLHRSSVQIHRFEQEDEELKSILGILRSSTEQHAFTLCIPEYRDALVFYSQQNEIVGILHLCFSCLMIADEYDSYFEVDIDIYPRLKQALVQIGHPVEE